MQVSTVGSWAKGFATVMGDKPSMWDSVYDAQRNGPLVAFTRQLNPKVMVKPDDYSEETMKQVAARYEKAAKKINAKRSANMTDSTVIYVLSESFSDPSRESSLTSPYQQLVPSEHWTPTINQMWGAAKNSIGLHPYESSMYSRATNYKKFGFSHFYTLTGPDVISHQDKIDDSPYVSDEATYESTIEEVKKTDGNQFLQVITMQNHMPYHDWYKNNDFKAESTTDTPLEDDEKESIETYQKGASLTDDATADFLAELDKLGKPVTVVFYGDHLPGIYSSASADDGNSLALHQTDYFIWSNKASGTQGNKIGNADYSSPNFFVPQAAEHMNAKVSPYLAFLTQMHEKISAMEPPVVNNIQGWDRIPEGQNIYLDADGNPMAESDFDAETKQLMADYKLIQYDITTGKNYLKDTSFMDLP